MVTAAQVDARLCCTLGSWITRDSHQPSTCTGFRGPKGRIALMCAESGLSLASSDAYERYCPGDQVFVVGLKYDTIHTPGPCALPLADSAYDRDVSMFTSTGAIFSQPST